MQLFATNFLTAYVSGMKVQHAVRSETEFYAGCGNVRCQSFVNSDEGTCPHCPTEGARKRWTANFTLAFGMDDVNETTVYVEFGGRNAPALVSDSFLEPDRERPEIFEFNDLVCHRFPKGMLLDVFLWYRPTRTEGVTSDPTKHMVKVRLANGEEWKTQISAQLPCPQWPLFLVPNQQPRLFQFPPQGSQN